VPPPRGPHVPAMTRICHLEALVGREAQCSGEACGFWQTEHGCVLDGASAELAGRPQVAQLLLEVRDRLTANREAADEERHAAFSHALNQAEDELG
jgi:hypothetical protein